MSKCVPIENHTVEKNTPRGYSRIIRITEKVNNKQLKLRTHIGVGTDYSRSFHSMDLPHFMKTALSVSIQISGKNVLKKITPRKNLWV